MQFRTVIIAGYPDSNSSMLDFFTFTVDGNGKNAFLMEKWSLPCMFAASLCFQFSIVIVNLFSKASSPKAKLHCMNPPMHYEFWCLFWALWKKWKKRVFPCEIIWLRVDIFNQQCKCEILKISLTISALIVNIFCSTIEVWVRPTRLFQLQKRKKVSICWIINPDILWSSLSASTDYFNRFSH